MKLPLRTCNLIALMGFKGNQTIEQLIKLNYVLSSLKHLAIPFHVTLIVIKIYPHMPIDLEQQIVSYHFSLKRFPYQVIC